MKNRSTLRLAYSRRIERPDASLIEPFRADPDPLNRFVGNPALRPELSHQLDLSLQQFTPVGMLQIAPFYRRTSDGFQRLKSVSADGTSTTRYANLASNDVFGSGATLSLRVSKVRGVIGVSASHSILDGGDPAGGVRTRGTAWSARTSLTYALSPARSLQYYYMYRSAILQQQGRLSEFHTGSVAFQQNFLDNRAVISIRLNDPFDTWRFRFQTADADHRQTSLRRSTARVLWINASYTVGSKPKVEDRAVTPPARQQNIGIQ